MQLHKLPTTPEVEARIWSRMAADQAEAEQPEAGSASSELLEEPDPVDHEFRRLFLIGYLCAVAALAIAAAVSLTRCGN